MLRQILQTSIKNLSLTCTLPGIPSWARVNAAAFRDLLFGTNLAQLGAKFSDLQRKLAIPSI
jgi:hypothetical protein